MRASLIKLWMAMGVVALLASGCNCGDPGACADIFVTFDSPKDKDTVPAVTDIVVSVADKDGVAVELDKMTICTRLVSGTECSVPRDGTYASGKVTFKAVTLEPGDNFVKVFVEKTGTTCSATKSIVVTVADSVPPKVLTVGFPQDLNNNKVLNAVELPSAAQLQVAVNTQGAIGGTLEIFDQAAPTTVLATSPVTTSMVTVQVPAATLTDKGYSFFAKVTKGTASNTAAANPEAVATITIARTPPTCALTAPTKTTVGPNDDADTVTAGFQLRTSGTASSSATKFELTLSGGATPMTSGANAPVNGGGSFDFLLPSTGGTVYTVTAIATDANDNKCTSTKQVTADFVGPGCTITSPTAAGSPYSGFNIPLTATVTNGEGGTVHFTTSIPAPRSISPDLAVTGGMSAAFTGTFTAGAQTVTATCTDVSGNATTTTQNIVVNATTTDGGGNPCSIIFAAPATKPALITTANYNVIVQTSCPSTVVTLKQTGIADKTATTNTNGVALFNLTGLVTSTFTWTAEIGANPVNSDQVDVTVDLNIPVITRPLLASGQTYALLNVATDLLPATAGAQALLQYTATVPGGGHVDICSNQTPQPGGATACADNVAGWWTLKANAPPSEPSFTFPEGSYSIKAVVVLTGVVQATSPALPIISDVTAPVISNIRFVGDVNSDKNLNIAELGGATPKLAFDLDAANPASSIATTTVSESASAPFNNAAGVTPSGQTITVTLDQGLTAPIERNFNFIVTVTDSAGNPSTATYNGARIDQVAPSCAIPSPATGTLLGGPDDASSSTAGFQLPMQITTSTDVPSVAVTLSGGQTNSASATPSGGIATNTWNLAQTNGVQTYAVGATCTDVAGNATPATARTAIVVDLDPPTCTITAPVASPPQYLNFGVATSVTVAGAAPSASVRIYSKVGAATRTLQGTLPVAGTAASGTVTYVTGVQSVTAEVDDAAGNIGSCGPVSIDVNASGCDIAFTNTTLVSGQYYLTSLPFTITGHSSNCAAGKVVTLFQVGNATPLGTGTTNASGDVSVNGTLPQGTGYTLRLSIDNGGGIITPVNLSPFTVDTIPPGVGSASPSGTDLSFVAATNFFVAAPGYVVDLTPGAPADFTVTVNNITGALGGKVAIFFKGVQVGPSVDITADPQAVLSFNATLPHNDSGTFEIRVSDEAGNVTKPVVAPAVIDVVAPDAPTVTLTRLDARAATMQLTWAPTYDDASSSASGPNAGYDIRWSTDTVTGNNKLATSADFFNSALAFPESLQAWSATTINRTLTLPPLNTYYIVVRAKDEVGNYSAYVAPGNGFDNNGAKDGLDNPTGTGAQNFGRLVVSNGSLNGDAIDDLVTASTTNNTVYVYFGRTGFGALTTCASPTCQQITLPGVSTGDKFGSDIMVGNVGDTAAPDLIVASSSYTTNTGRVFLFFGGANPIDTSTFIEFRGPATGAFFGFVVQVLPDISGDGIPELAIADNEDAGRAKVYIFKGRSKAAWQALVVGGFVPTTAADFVIRGPSPLTGNTFFGLNHLGYTSLGDINGDGTADFAIPDAKDSINKLYLFSGATVAASTPAAPITTGISPGIPSQTLQELTDGKVGVGSNAGYGTVAFGGRNFIGATGNDLLVTNPVYNTAYIYSDPALPISTSSLTITGNNLFGSGGAIGKLKNATEYDLVISENATTTSTAWIFYHRPDNSYDNSIGLGFWQSKISGPSVGTTGVFGLSVATGDFDNDSRADLALSDPSTNPGRVLVWH